MVVVGTFPIPSIISEQRCSGLRPLAYSFTGYTFTVAMTVNEGKDVIKLEPGHRGAANKRLLVKYLWTRMIRAVIRHCKRKRHRSTMLLTIRTSPRLPLVLRLLAMQYESLLTDQMLRCLCVAYRLPHDHFLAPTNFWRHSFNFAKENSPLSPPQFQGHPSIAGIVLIGNNFNEWECKGTLMMSF